MTNTIYVVGHKKPDTDSVASAIAYANYKTKTDTNNTYIPIICGDTNTETTFILNKFNIEKPKLIETIESAEKKQDIIVVDHNHLAQLMDNHENINVVEIVDHHNKADITTDKPIFSRIEPVGSTATVISKMFFEKQIEIEKNISILLISAILSDTLYLKSSTATNDDKEMLEKLNKIANLDLDTYANEVFEAKSDITGKTTEQIINSDKKEFKSDKYYFAIGQVETVSTKALLDKKEDFIEYIKNEIKEKSMDASFLMVTDILNNASHVFIATENQKVIDFFKIKDNYTYLENVMSRKKDLLPKIYDLF